MIKHKMKLISLIALLIISLLVPIVNAENETADNQVNPISELGEEITIKDGDEYLFQDTVTIDNPIDGNVFIFADTVTINSQIGGDAFIFANTINIEENGYILSNLFACSNMITVKGAVYNIYSIGDMLTIDGFVYRDIRSICNTLNINGMIGRNVFVNCSNIQFKESSDTEENSSITSYGSIQGNLNYFSEEEIRIPENAVSGETNFTALKSNTVSISTYIYSLGTILVYTIVVWLIGLWIAPKFIHNTNKTMTVKKVLQIIGLGILVPVIIALLAFIVLLIPIATRLSMLLLCVLFILFFISISVAIISINEMICNKFNIKQTIGKLGFLIVTTIVFWLLTLIPYIGVIISLLAIIWGIGTVCYKVLITEKEKKSEE